MATASDLPPPPERAGEGVRCDVLIVGAGAAGLYTACCLPDGLDVVIVDKGRDEAATGSSPWAQAGLAAAVGPDDTPELHAQDTRQAGDGSCDPHAVAVLTREAPEHVERLVALGARFDRHDGRTDAAAPLDLAREGGQRIARSVRRADETGAELIRVLRAAAAPRVRRLPGIVVELATDDDRRVTGAWVLDGDGTLVGVDAGAVVLATGGCGALFAATTNPDSSTGDGLSLAAGVGAAVRDVEFVQFHPTAIATGDRRRVLLTEALRGDGATLHAADGSRFMRGIHPDAELAPRHVVAQAILAQQHATAYLDATGIGAGRLRQEFPTAVAGAASIGLDLTGERIPVTPAAHYHMGGVRTDLWARSSLPGLYACGEAASTGVHGANRLAGNSLSEALVFGARAAEAVAADHVAPRATTARPPRLSAPPSDPAALRRRLQDRMLRGAGPVRDEGTLARLESDLVELAAHVGGPSDHAAALELWHAVRAARLIVRAARLRTESRGGHHRLDFPLTDHRWQTVHLEQVGLPDA